MQPTTINIKDLTVDQLKAYAYDTMVRIQFEQQNLARLQTELEQRTKEESKDATEETT